MRRTFSDSVLAKKVFIKSYGCQMNVYDSARMEDVMNLAGYMSTANANDADLVVLNTCHIREKAAEKLYSELGRLREAKSEKTVIAVAGCVAQAEQEEIARRAPYVDVIVGPQSYHRLPKLVTTAESSKLMGLPKRVIDTNFPVESKFDSLPDARGKGPVAFLTIQEGCDKFCSFCVVPYTRGAEFSRPIDSIVSEARQLIEGGVVEITLLGQNVNAYHGDENGLAGLIRKLAKLDGLDRIRYTTSHPKDMSKELIAAHGDVPELMPYLHLPIQSGSNKILSIMNRQHVVDDYIKVIEELRSVRPDIALSSDFIVGHPGETEKDFDCTLALVESVRFAQAYSFKFSQRPGTPASDMGGQVLENVKAQRLKTLQNLLNRQQLEFNDQFPGQLVPVLFERRGKLSGQIAGRTPYMQAVYVNCKGEEAVDNYFGKTLPVRVTEAFGNSLTGSLEPPVLQT